MNSETVRRFWEKVNKTESCWLWVASKRCKGYGAFVWADESGRIIQGRAHRFSYLIHVGTIPDGLCILHRCDNPSCVNPDHLFAGTKADNNRDMIEKGRKVNGGVRLREHGRSGNYERGEKHHGAKFNEETIRAIRQDAKLSSYSRLASKYSVSIGHLHRIIHRKAWAHVE